MHLLTLCALQWISTYTINMLKRNVIIVGTLIDNWRYCTLMTMVISVFVFCQSKSTMHPCLAVLGARCRVRFSLYHDRIVRTRVFFFL